MGQEDVRPPVRLGLIGLGPWAERYLATAALVPGAEFVAVSRRSPGPVPDLASGLLFFHNWRNMLREGLDGVVVAAHPSLHREVVQACSEAGVAVMLEKPMALSLPEAQAIHDLRPAVPVLVNHVHLFSPAFDLMRRLVAQSGAGDVSIISCGAGPGPFRDYSSLWDYGPHDVSMCLALAGPASGDVAAERIPAGKGETFRLRFRLGGGRADVTVGNSSPEKIRVVRAEFGDRVAIYDDRSRVKLSVDGAPVAVSDVPPLTAALQAFTRAASDGHVDWRFGTEVGLSVCRVLASVPA